MYSSEVARRPLPDVIVLDTALHHGATSIATFDEKLAARAVGRPSRDPWRTDHVTGLDTFNLPSPTAAARCIIVGTSDRRTVDLR